MTEPDVELFNLLICAVTNLDRELVALKTTLRYQSPNSVIDREALIDTYTQLKIEPSPDE